MDLRTIKKIAIFVKISDYAYQSRHSHTNIHY